MNNEIKRRAQALEDDFFYQREKEALVRLTAKKEGGERLSPVSGKPMEQKALHGVVIDQCRESGGIWLDAGELEQIIEAFKKDPSGGIEGFFSAVLGKK